MSVNYQSGDVDAHGAAIRAQAMAHKGTAIMNHTEKRTKLHDTRAANLRAATDATARIVEGAPYCFVRPYVSGSERNRVMRRRILTVIVAALAVLLTVTACSTSGDRAGSSTAPGGSIVPPDARAHNDADVMFAQHMIPHHQQAIQMSDSVLGKQGIDPRVIQLANQIKAAQGPEIQQMQGWLSQWAKPTMPMMPSSMTPQSTMPGMPGVPSQSGMPGMTGMSGMMSEQDIQALQNAQGLDASKLFLTQMIEHHQGAITMAQNEIKSGQYQPAIGLAHSIVTNQQQQINTMQSILGSL